MKSDFLYTVDQGTPAFEAARAAVDVVCAGDSLTGWNNFGPATSWPYRTYPDFLQELCGPLGLKFANGGIAGEVSDNGPQQVRDYLELFPNARYFIIGMGANDLGTWRDTAATSKRIIGNLGKMVQAVKEQGKQTVLFNVPNVNEAMFLPYVIGELREKRDYHNARLSEYCGPGDPAGRHLFPSPRRAFRRQLAPERRRCENHCRGSVWHIHELSPFKSGVKTRCSELHCWFWLLHLPQSWQAAPSAIRRTTMSA